MKVYGRDRAGHLLAAIVVSLPPLGVEYVRKVRLVRWEDTDVRLRVRVARERGDTHT